jgi:hypothetical protein
MGRIWHTIRTRSLEIEMAHACGVVCVARNTLAGPGGAIFPFMDLSTGECWTVAPNEGRIPWWVLVASRGVKGARLADYLALLKLRRARGNEPTPAQRHRHRCRHPRRAQGPAPTPA